MRTTTSLLLPTPALVEQLIDAERDCMVDWLTAMAALPGNPLGSVIENFGRATALVCSKIPAQVFNRVIGMTMQDCDHLPAILAIYEQHRASPMFDLSPYANPPSLGNPKLAAVARPA